LGTPNGNASSLRVPGPKIILVADCSYAALVLLDSLLHLSDPVYMVTQLRLEAALYEPAPERTLETLGQPRKKAKRLPKLSEVLVNAQTIWQEVTVDNWYGKGPPPVEITSDTAAWDHNDMPVVPIRDPKGRFETRALLCTDPSAEPVQILKWFVRRWQVVVTFQQVRTLLGVETQR
jgi:hypothetical protein